MPPMPILSNFFPLMVGTMFARKCFLTGQRIHVRYFYLKCCLDRYAWRKYMKLEPCFMVYWLMWMIFSRLFIYSHSSAVMLNILACFIVVVIIFRCNPVQVTKIICLCITWSVRLAASTQRLYTQCRTNGANPPLFKCFHIAISPLSCTFYIWPFCLAYSRAIKYWESLMFPGTRTQIK